MGGIPRKLAHPDRVRRDDLQPPGEAGRAGRDGRRQRGGQRRVHLHRDDPGRRLQERKRQRAEARADFEDDVTGLQPGQGDDPPHRAVIDDEVLAEPFGRPHPEPYGQIPDLGRPQQSRPGHHGPKMRSPVAVTSAQSSARSMFFTSARRRAV